MDTMQLTKVIADPSQIVSKLIFETKDAIAETVAYRYQNRGVICFSVQSGCKVGCVFCGTGRKFIRDLTAPEMMAQIKEALRIIGPKEKIQLMSMSMGEPMDNWQNLKEVVSQIFSQYPKFHFYVSTVGLDYPEVLNDFLLLGQKFPKFGLQFSLHHHDQETRRKRLGNYPYLLPIVKIREFARNWTNLCQKPCYFNYICTGKETDADAKAVFEIVSGMHLTCSVLCNTHELAKGNPQPAQEFANKLMAISDGKLDVSVFDPAGQDTIGGGCGQLLYVQKKMHAIQAS